MSDQSFEQMLNDSFKTIHNGEVVTGTVIGVKEDAAMLNIGYKSDGILKRDEYSNDATIDLRNVLHEGDTIDVKVLKVNDGEGQVLLSYKRIAFDKGNKRIEEAYNNKEVLTSKVVKYANGGLTVEVEGAPVFIPASLVSDIFEKDLSKYMGQEIQFVVTEFNPRKRRVIGDRKKLIVADKEERIKALLDKIHVGDTVEGTVKNVTDFGAFVDIGGADGLLHVSEMSWGKVLKAKDKVSVGDKVETFIKDIKGDKISLSMKFDNTNPWQDAIAKYAPGNEVEGKVARLTDFGAFVELEEGVDALLHVSQISRQHVDKPSDVLKVGQIIKARIVDFNEADKKISLSMKALEVPETAEATEATEETKETPSSDATASEE